MQDFSWRPEGERPHFLIPLLYPVLGIAVGVLIGVALTSGAWDGGQPRTRAERLSLPAKDPLNLPRETDRPTTTTTTVTAAKENRPVIILNPTAVETPSSPVAPIKQVSPHDVVPPGQEQVEISTPRPVASTETPQQSARDYRALRLQMLRAVRP
jgi:hypothetical protein